jgi:hypothetical protein
MKNLIAAFLLFFLWLSGSLLFAFGNLSADEVRILLTGNTAEGERREGVKGGQGTPGIVNMYAEKFTIFFAENGTVKRRVGEQHKTGKWRVTDNGELCLRWKNKKEKCAPVYKDGKNYKRVTIKPSGRVLWELTFISFTPGNEYGL